MITALKVTIIPSGFKDTNPASRKDLLLINLSKAFHVVDRDKLLDKVEMMDLKSNLKSQLLCHL